MKLTDKQTDILTTYVKIAKDGKKIPTRADLITNGISRDKIRNAFGNVEKLAATAKKLHPNLFKQILERKPHELQDFTREALGSIIKENNHQDGTYFITAASPTSYLDWSDADYIRANSGQDVLAKNLFEPGFKAVQTFLKENNAKMVILPMRAHVKALQKQPLHYDPRLKPYKNLFATEYTFNRHLKAIDAYLNPQQINPLTGLKRLRIHKYRSNNKAGEEIRNFKTSVILAHSKQALEVIPTGNSTHPRLIHSTGAITKPSYLRNRIGMIADEDHKLGGLVIEIKGDVFWLRQVQFDVNNGSFVDLGKRYHANGKVTAERAEAFKMGDLHAVHHDDKALEAMYRLWDQIKPKNIFFEDFFDGSSISHHLDRKKLSKAKLPPLFESLPIEIAAAKTVLHDIWENAPKDAKMFATASNHPHFLTQYLDEGRYMNDRSDNYELAHRMVVMSLDGKDPLKEYLDPKGRMTWTSVNADIYIEGVQMNVHGHQGINGAKGSKIGHELAYGNVMTAHTHAPSIYHDAFTVGHMSSERHGYNNGPSTWILCNGAVYKGGQKQLYMIVNGSSYLPKKGRR